jgi:hypothetical protein
MVQGLAGLGEHVRALAIEILGMRISKAISKKNRNMFFIRLFILRSLRF